MVDYSQLLSQRAFQYYEVGQHNDYEEMVLSDTRVLIVPQRLDVLIKLYYIDAYVRKLDMHYPVEVYNAHIHSITGFTNKENGQLEKSSQAAFVNIFNNLIDSFQKEGFNEKKSIVPVSKEGVILDGAHRVACSIYFKTPLKVLKLNYVTKEGAVRTPIYDYSYFQRYALPEEYLDLAARQYLKYTNKNVYIACLWPSVPNSTQRKKAVEKIAERYPLVYCKNVKLSFQALDRLISQVYMNDSWVGDVVDNFKGSTSKTLMCYNPKGCETFIMFEGGSKDETLCLKEEVRELFNIGKHSIHITDNTKESNYIGNYVFSTTTINFLEKAQLGKCPQLMKDIQTVNEGEVLNFRASTILCGLEKYDGSCNLLLKDSDLKKGYSIEDVKNNPNLTYTYVGKQFFNATEDISKDILKVVPTGPYLASNKLKNSRLIKQIYYLKKYYRVKFLKLINTMCKLIKMVIRK